MAENSDQPHADFSAKRLFWILLCTIFLAELLVMFLLELLPPLSNLNADLLDSTLLLILVFPVLHRFLLRPMSVQISEIRQAKVALQESEARFRNLTAISSDFYWETDAEHRLTMRTESKREAAEEVFMRAASIGKRRWEISYLAPDEAGWQAHRAMLDAHLPFRDFEISRLRANGKMHHISISGDPTFDASGVFRGYRGVGADITGRKQEGEALRESERRYRSLVENSPLCIHEIALDGRIVSMNRTGLLMMGVSDESEVQGLPYLDAVSGGDRDRIGKLLSKAYAGEASNFEFKASGSNEQIFQSCFVPIRNSDGNVVKLMGITEDITERKKTEAEVRRVNAELEHRVEERTRDLQVANRELESFAYSVSHDLRAPLRAIEGFSRLIETEYVAHLDERGKDYFRRIRGGATRMANLIDDLLKLSRISRQKMNRELVNLSALLREAAEDLQGAEPERRIEWVIAPQVTVEGDRGLLQVLVQNLIGNAWKYSSKRETARIEFGVGDRNGRPAYFVRDNGAGFDMAYGDKLFGAFQRLHSPGEYPGTGIGLATVKRIIHRHGGEVWADGRVGEGATFYFTL